MTHGIIHTMEQGTDTWHEVKRGKLGASSIAAVMAGGSGKTRDKLMVKLALERLTGKCIDGYKSSSMAAGNEREPEAREAYEFLYGCEVEQVGFIEHPFIKNSGASPDGLIGLGGGVEIKCPEEHTHYEYLKMDPGAPSQYVKQIQFNMACSGRQWWDFVSYQPEFPLALRLIVHRIERDDDIINQIENAIIPFLKDVDAAVLDLQEMAGE